MGRNHLPFSLALRSVFWNTRLRVCFTRNSKRAGRGKTAARTIGESDVNAFSALTGDYTYLHTDAEAAAKTPFGERVGHGLLGLSFLMGLVTRLGDYRGDGRGVFGLGVALSRSDSLR